MFRGSLISLIFSKTLRMSATKISDAEAITLMSADIDRIALSLELVHEFYSSFIEIALSMWLLYRLLGVAMAASTAHVVGANTHQRIHFYSHCKRSRLTRLLKSMPSVRDTYSRRCRQCKRPMVGSYRETFGCDDENAGFDEGN